MGFFSDLKEDLSQAVNELMPEEALDTTSADGAETENVLSGEQYAQETSMAEETLDTVDSFDISSMLDRLDGSNEMAEDTLAEPENADAADVSDDSEEDLSWTRADDVTEATEVLEETESEDLDETVEEKEPESIEEVLEVVEEKEPEEVEEELLLPTESEEAESEIDNTLSQPNEEEEKTMDMQTNRVAVDETAVVTEGMTITGDIVSEGSMELIGTVNGNLDIYGKLNITGKIQGNSKAAEIYAEGAKIVGEVNSDGSVKIGQSSVIIGNISATSAVIAGAVKGDIDVHGPVILDTTAIVMGNIKSKSVQINNGAVIEGLCSQCYADISPSTFFEEFKKQK